MGNERISGPIYGVKEAKKGEQEQQQFFNEAVETSKRRIDETNFAQQMKYKEQNERQQVTTIIFDMCACVRVCVCYRDRPK